MRSRVIHIFRITWKGWKKPLKMWPASILAYAPPPICDQVRWTSRLQRLSFFWLNSENQATYFKMKKKTFQDCKRLPRVHLIGWGVKWFLPKGCFKFCQKLSCQNLSWVFFLQNLSLSFYFFHSLSFLVLLLFELYNIFSFEFCQSFCFLSQFHFFLFYRYLSF